VDEKSQVLKHSNQWVETIDPSVVPMQAMLTSTVSSTNMLFETLTSNLSKLSKIQYTSYNKDKMYTNAFSRHSPLSMNMPSKYAQDSPDWVYIQPKNLQETHAYRGQIWSFCGKCGCNGKWICTHTKATHWSSDFLQ
jgi:hypothetical protein